MYNSELRISHLEHQVRVLMESVEVLTDLIEKKPSGYQLKLQQIKSNIKLSQVYFDDE